MDIKIYSDGCCYPNPGKGTYGYVVYENGVEVHLVVGDIEDTTNNKMEMAGAYQALEYAIKIYSGYPIRVLSDSQYVVKGYNEWSINWVKKKFKDVKNSEIWIEFIELKKIINKNKYNISLEWIKGHNGTIGNERIDSAINEHYKKIYNGTPKYS